ncbi:MAG: hypothetical protein M1838_003920 [Thelocarpon superellum]|nr:MAG: hypothetical protein M1838_003920 [Thelocarpon superellum]
MDNVNCYKWISRKIKDYDRVLQDAILTPRLEERLEQAKDVFESALKLQDTDILSLTRGLRRLDKDVEGIYASSLGSIEKSAELLDHVTAIRGFVRALLFDDYGLNPAHSVRRILNLYDYVVTGKILSGADGRAQVAREYGRTEVDDPLVTETMQIRLRDCAREMLLDADELTRDFIEFAARGGKRRDRVQELVRGCKWDELAQKLSRDRRDLSRLLPRKLRLPRSCQVSWYQELVDRIAAVGNKYFDSIASPVRPSLRARRLSDKAGVVQSVPVQAHQHTQPQPQSHPQPPYPTPFIFPQPPSFRRTQSVSDVGKLQRPLPPLPPISTTTIPATTPPPTPILASIPDPHSHPHTHLHEEKARLGMKDYRVADPGRKEGEEMVEEMTEEKEEEEEEEQEEEEEEAEGENHPSLHLKTSSLTLKGTGMELGLGTRQTAIHTAPHKELSTGTETHQTHQTRHRGTRSFSSPPPPPIPIPIPIPTPILYMRVISAGAYPG